MIELNERILYYTGENFLEGKHAVFFRNGERVEPTTADLAKYINVGTIGHCDWSPYPRKWGQVYLTPLQQAIRDVNNNFGHRQVVP